MQFQAPTFNIRPEMSVVRARERRTDGIQRPLQNAADTEQLLLSKQNLEENFVDVKCKTYQQHGKNSFN